MQLSTKILLIYSTEIAWLKQKNIYTYSTEKIYLRKSKILDKWLKSLT